MIYNPLANLQWAVGAFKVIFTRMWKAMTKLRLKPEKKIKNTLQRVLVALHFTIYTGCFFEPK